MKDEIIKALREGPKTMEALSVVVPGWEGDAVMCQQLREDIVGVVWGGMSREVIAVLEDLLERGEVLGAACCAKEYSNPGKVFVNVYEMGFHDEGDGLMVWLPTIFRLGETKH